MVAVNFATTDNTRWGAGTGAGPAGVLTPTQADIDLWNLKVAIETLQAAGGPVGISGFSVSGAELTVTMTDASTRGPFTLPVATLRSRGAWAPLTAYLVNDTFYVNGAVYTVIFAHTSASTFSAGANDGMGHNYYQEFAPNPGNAIATGGAVGQVYTKTSTADFAASWQFIAAINVTFAPSTASGLTSTNVSAALEEIEALIGGAGALHTLSDVNVTEGSGINGYFLQWNNATSKWVAAASSSNLSGLADVNVTEGSGINGFFLKWDNATSKWVAAASSASLSGLSDVNVTEGAGIDGYSLKWNNGTSKWVASLSALSGLSDVNVTEGSGIDGYFLKWNNATSKWVASLSGATAVALSGLSDVNITEGSGIDGYTLNWANGSSKWVATASLKATANTWALAQTFTVAPVFTDASGTRTALGLGTIATKAATSGSAVQKGDGSGGLTAATAGVDYGFANIPQNSKSTAYTTVLGDAGGHILHPAADTTARTFTIDSNANVAYPIGTALTFVNQHGAGVITIAITSDTMRLAGAGTTGSRTLAADGIATALKIASTEWIISGTGLT
jgi:hypothetical protein